MLNRESYLSMTSIVSLHSVLIHIRLLSWLLIFVTVVVIAVIVAVIMVGKTNYLSAQLFVDIQQAGF